VFVSSIVYGTVLASHFFGGGVFYLLGLVTLSYAVLAVSPPASRGSVVAALVVSYNIGTGTSSVADPDPARCAPYSRIRTFGTGSGS
jgi:hypothetical protein